MNRALLKPTDIVQKKILIAPLNWGLGHATRCIPIIRQLIEQKNDVTIAGSGHSLLLLQREFPSLTSIELNDYGVKYYTIFPMFISMGVQIPKIIKAINKENNLLDKILKKEKYDIIISDNRYGLYTEKAICIFITHQLNINAGIFENLVNKIQHSFIKRFNYCWVPDYETESQSLAGALSKKNKYFKNVLYIGPQSIFKKTEQHSPAFDLCFLLSGPEPQRSRLERNIFEWCSNTKKKICIVRGTDIPLNIKYEDNIIVYNLVEPSLINQLFYNCKMIVCRSGYSTIMDLHHIGKTAIFIPTPGQTEQEYLAKYHELKHKAKIIKQKELVEKLEELLN